MTRKFPKGEVPAMIEDKVWIVEWIDPPYDHEIEKIFQSESDAKEYIESQPKKVQKALRFYEFRVEPSRDLDTVKALAQAVSMGYDSGVEAANHHAGLMRRKGNNGPTN
jgi:hypothetical protein